MHAYGTHSVRSIVCPLFAYGAYRYKIFAEVIAILEPARLTRMNNSIIIVHVSASAALLPPL